MYVEIICVGKLKEKYLRDAVQEYMKRLSRYCKVEVIEVKEEIVPSCFSPGDMERVLKTEAERIKKNIKEGSYIIALDINGEQVSSGDLAERIQALMLWAGAALPLLSGAALGSIFSSGTAHWRLSFSKMTFPHQLMRVFLCEQLYRGFTIMKHEPYHRDPKVLSSLLC